MTKKEALELETKCDNLLSESTGYTCTVSQALGGNLRIQFGENNISINKYDLDYNQKIDCNLFYVSNLPAMPVVA